MEYRKLGSFFFYLLTGIRYFSILQMELLVGIMASLISEKYNRMLKI